MTYAPPQMTSDQEVFDYVVRHLHRQNGKAINQYKNCSYRSPEGLRCAVGCLIADEHYSKWIEGTGANGEAASGAVQASIGYLTEDSELLSRLQEIHDRRMLPTWPSHLLRVALQAQLAPTAIYECWPDDHQLPPI